MKTELKVGDVVRLKSGGPTMTIERRRLKVEADCVWFIHVKYGQTVQRACFHIDVLELVPK